MQGEGGPGRGYSWGGSAIPNGSGGHGEPKGAVGAAERTGGDPGRAWGRRREIDGGRKGEARRLPGCGAGSGAQAAPGGECRGRAGPVRGVQGCPGPGAAPPDLRAGRTAGAGAGGPGPAHLLFLQLVGHLGPVRPAPARPSSAPAGPRSGSGSGSGSRLGLGRTRAPLGGVSASPPPARSTAARRGPSGVCALLIGSRAARSARQPGAASSHWLPAAQRLPLFSHWLGRV